MANSPNPKGLPMHKALAMGLKPKVNSGTGVKTPFNPGNVQNTAIPGTSKKMPGTMPSQLKIKTPKGAK